MARYVTSRRRNIHNAAIGSESLEGKRALVELFQDASPDHGTAVTTGALSSSMR
jgi:hypothetical protein